MNFEIIFQKHKILDKLFNNAVSAISFFQLLENNTRIKTLALPDVILLDINMPKMNGFSFFEEFKHLDFCNKNDIQVYLLSSSMCPNDILRAQKETYCAGYITKPLTVDKLERLLNEPVVLKYQEHFKKII